MKRIFVVTIAVIGLMLMSCPVQADLSSGLVAYYPFNGNANDESRNGNDGTVHGATLATDRCSNDNKAYSFDGTGQRIDIPSIDNSGSVTVSLWHYYTGSSDSGSNQVAFIDDNEDHSLAMSDFHSSPIFVFSTDVDIYQIQQNVLDVSKTIGWHHFCLIYDASDSKGKAYIDGSLIGTADINGALKTISGNDGHIGIGRTNWNDPSYLNGIIDDVRIYNRALSVSEVQDLYNEGTCEKGFLLAADEYSWVSHPSNPILSLGATDSFDDRDAYDCSVIKHNGTYHMWYRGEKENHNNEIGYAKSTNGIDWIKQNNSNPVLSSPWVSENDHGANIQIPRVIIDDAGEFRMYYSRTYGFGGEPEKPREVWTAHSTDGTNWIDHTFIVGDNAYFPSPLYENGTYHLWYRTEEISVSGKTYHISSSDGVNFSDPTIVNLNEGGNDTWEKGINVIGSVIKTTNGFQTWFGGGIKFFENSDRITCAIGVAYSSDGINWTKSPNNPVFYASPLGYEDSTVLLAALLIDTYAYKMYYSSWSLAGNKRLGLAIRKLNCDVNDDGKTGMEEAINALQIVGGVKE